MRAIGRILGNASLRKLGPHWPLWVIALLCNVNVASAAPLTIECEAEDRMVESWTGPLTISYSGGASGDVTVKSEHVTFSLPATQTGTPAADGTQKPTILGSGETSSAMPDPQALKACIDGALPPEQANDEDKQFQALRGCVPKVAMSPSPIGVRASITIIVGGLLPGDNPNGVIVAIKRRYADVRTASGTDVTLRTSPDKCKIAGQ